MRAAPWAQTMTENAPGDRTLRRLPRRSPRFFSFFARYLRWYLGRSFHRVLLVKAPDALASLRRRDRPVVVVLNHPSWHDPLLCVHLAEALLPGRPHFAPIDAEALRHYGFLAKLGLYPVDPTTRGGIRDFLATSLAILNEPGAMLWITAQGKFSDVRERPVTLMPGIAHVVTRLDDVVVHPLAIDLTFWHERRPEALVAFGPAVTPPSRDLPPSRRVDAWNEAISHALERTQDELQRIAIARDEDAMEPLLLGSRSTSLFYDAWNRIKGIATGRRPVSGHGDLVRRP